MDDCGTRFREPRGRHPLNASVLVLNRHYAPVRIVTARRAFCLLVNFRAEAIDRDEATIAAYRFEDWICLSSTRFHTPLNGEEFVRTPCFPILVPRVIRLPASDRRPSWTVQLTRRNVLARDEYRCQYCAKRLPPTKLSVDHVVPRSRGGRTEWTNVVAACRTCNTRKGRDLPKEAGMAMLQAPRPPRPNPLWTARDMTERHELWRQFLSDRDFPPDERRLPA